MTLLDWSPALELGIDVIDSQHHTLLDTMNLLNGEILRGKSATACTAALLKMKDYTITHFRDEETLMVESDFPSLEGHRQLHQKFAAETEKFASMDCGDEADKVLEVLNFLQEWLVDHILGPDLIFAKHYKAFLESQA